MRYTHIEMLTPRGELEVGSWQYPGNVGTRALLLHVVTPRFLFLDRRARNTGEWDVDGWVNITTPLICHGCLHRGQGSEARHAAVKILELGPYVPTAEISSIRSSWPWLAMR